MGCKAHHSHLTDVRETESPGRTLAQSHMGAPEAEDWSRLLPVLCHLTLSQPQGLGTCDVPGAEAFWKGTADRAAWLMGGQARPGRCRVLGGRGELRVGQCRVRASPYRKLSSASARGPGQLESGGHLGSGSRGRWAAALALAPLGVPRGLSQEMVEEVLTSFRVELEAGGRVSKRLEGTSEKEQH